MSLKNKWLKLSGYGAVWLMTATLLTKLIGVMQKIPLQNLAGDSVFGIYNIVYPIYQMMIALGVAGIPTALATYMAAQKQLERERTLSVALGISFCAALIMSLLGFASSSLFAAVIGHDEVIDSLRVLSLALLITPLIAVYRGYYQGIDHAKLSSISQLIEQLVRVACMVLLLWIGLNLHWSDQMMAAAVMWGSVAGAGVTLIWFISRRKADLSKIFKHKWSQWRLEAAKLLKLALPSALAATVVPMVAVVDALSIPRLLTGSSSEVMAQFGQYSRIQPLIQLVSMLLAALAAGFLPRWLKQLGNNTSSVQRLHGNRLLIMHRIALIISCGAAAGLYILAEPINIMLYKDTEGLTTFRLLSITTVASSLLAIQAPLLQGAGIMRLSIWLLMIASGSKAMLNLLLVPKLGIVGAALSANLSLACSALVGMFTLYFASTKMSCMNLRKMIASELFKPFIAIIASSIAMYGALYIIDQLSQAERATRLQMTGYVFAAICVGAIVYGAVIWLCRAVKQDELKRLL